MTAGATGPSHVIDPDDYKTGYSQPGNWDRLGRVDFNDTYDDPCSSVEGERDVEVTVHARRVFKTGVNFGDDTAEDHFYTQLRFKVKITIEKTDDQGVTTTTVTEYTEYAELPNGIFIRPTLNNYHDGNTNTDWDGWVCDYIGGAYTLPPGPF